MLLKEADQLVVMAATVVEVAEKTMAVVVEQEAMTRLKLKKENYNEFQDDYA